MAAKRKSRFRKLKKIFRPTVGKLLGILMLAYFVFTFFSYKDRVQVSYYEVEEGSLVKEHNYTGLIIRDEEIFDAQANGYIYYYVADGRKAAKGSPVYSIDEGGQLMNYLNTHSEQLSELNSSKVSDIRAEMLGFSRTFNPANFRSLYNIKNTLDAHTIEYASMNIFSTISRDLVNAGISFKEFPADKTGVVCCYTDGYEDVSEADIKETLFEKESYDKISIKAGDLVSVGSPAYKMINGESWEIAFPMKQEDIDEFGDQSILKVRFPDKGFDVKCKFKTITGSDSRPYGILMMDSYIVQFTSDRFIDFEVVTNDVSGLKIPVKSVTKKDFYVIPSSYLKEDANGNSGFYKAVFGATGTSAQFVMPEIFNNDGENCYIDCDETSPLQPGDYVLPDPSGSTAGLKPPVPQDETAAESAADTEEPEREEDAQDREDTETGSESGSGSEESGEGSSAEDSGETEAESTESSAAESKTAASSSEAGNASAAGSGTDQKGMYQIASRMSLDGVYNVNKGYTVFRKVEILETANGYSIVRKGSSYGLQVYDHIVLDASMVHDGQLLYR